MKSEGRFSASVQVMKRFFVPDGVTDAIKRARGREKETKAAMLDTYWFTDQWLGAVSTPNGESRCRYLRDIHRSEGRISQQIPQKQGDVHADIFGRDRGGRP